MDKFEKAIIGNYSNYRTESSFQSVVFGHSTPLLETELNELQQIQEEARTQLIRTQVYSGFSELVQQDFLGEKYIFKPTVASFNNSVEMTNCLAIAPFTAYVNGYKIDGKGNFLYKGNEYILIDIGDTTEDTIDDTLIYLEAWFEYAKGDYIPKKYGYVLGNDVSENIHKRIIMDDRVNQETSRRKVLCWNICVKQECNFDLFPNGLGYKNQNQYSHVFGRANGQYGLEDNVNLAFKEATRDDFIGENFNYDKNLYVAGSKNYNTTNKSLAEKYIFALPMFRIRRRNKRPYSIENYNGSYSVTDNFNSRINGDIQLRPDRKCYDIIYDEDIMDIRKSINFSDYNNESLGDEVIKDLFNGNLTTKQKVRMRRVQFGNKHLKYNSSDVDNIYPDVPQKALIIPFDRSYAPVFPTGEVLIDKGVVEYEDSIHGYGAKILKGENLRYKISSTGINVKEGTFDFWIKPFFNGTDKEDMTIFELTDIGNNPILTLKKVKTEFILSQYNYALDGVNEAVKSEAIMDLSTDLLLSDRYYFMRVSWTHNPMPTNSQMYLYINGELKAQADIAECYLDPYYLYFGSKDNTREFLIEEFIAYITNFEVLSSAGTYGFAKNNFWAFIPQDFKDTEDVLMLPNFNSIVNNYSDDSFVQEETVFHLYAQTVNTQNMFYIKLTSDKIVRSIEKVYALDGSNVVNNIINLGTNNVSIQVYDQTVQQIIVVATLELSKGCGGIDVPTEILQASIMKYDDESDNYKYNLNVYKEVSFADYNSEEPRQVTLVAPERPDGNVDSAYDVSNHYRKRNQCYARLIHYNITKSTSMSGSNQFDIPIYVYGYKVAGVIGSSVNQIAKVVKVPSLITGEDDEKFTVYMKNPVEVGATITFYLATEGYSFDYELNSKSLMVNMCQCRTLHFEADGTNSTFTLPCINIEDDGNIHGGILKSVFTLSNNVLDKDGNVVFDENGNRKTTETVLCYHDGMVYYDEEGNPTIERKFNTQRITVNTESFGTPFITVNFDSENKPRKGTIIQIPIVVTYQMPEDILMSIWYNYLPYQGLLDKNEVTVKRLTDWKYFITTLGTGKTDEEEISCNIVNNLPGGFAEGYRVNNKPITLKNMFNNMSYTLEHYHLNQKVVFLKDYMLGMSSPFYNLVNTIKINKNGKIAQDGLINFDEEMIVYFSDCVNAINKYIGAYCTVITDTGEIMVLVVGNINYNETIVNVLCPIYGDLYRITGRPTSKR